MTRKYPRSSQVIALAAIFIALFFWLAVLPSSSTKSNSSRLTEASAELAAAPAESVPVGVPESRLGATSFASPAIMFAPNITATKTDSLFIDVNNNGKADPGDTLKYTVAISNTGSDALNVAFNDTIDTNTTLVPGSVNTSPLAFNDSYSAIGNVSISPNIAQGLLANDFDADGNTLTVTGNTAPSAGGNLTVNADGSFTYNPPAGFEGTCTFNYTISDGQTPPLTDTGTVTITVSGMIWFVDDSLGVNGDGRLSSPFNSLPNFVSGAADDPGDNIFLFRQTATNYAGPLTLLNNQRLIGQGATASLSSITSLTPQPYSATLPSTGGIRPVISHSATNLTLGSGNTVRGLNLSNTGGTALTGTSFGSLTVNDCSVTNTNGIGVNLSTGTANATFTSISSTGGSSGIILNATGGSFTVTGDGGGSNNGSGGVILNSTSHGVLLTTATGVSLGYMNITNSGGATDPNVDGIHGTGITGLTLTRCNVTDNAGDETLNAQGISLSGALNGAFNITNCVLGPNRHDNLQVRPTIGTITAFNITGGTITGSVGNSGINFNVAGTTIVSAFTMDSTTISNNFADGIQLDAADTSVISHATIQNCSFTGNNIAMDMDSSQSGSNTFKILTNNLQNQHSHAINVFAGGTGGGINALIQGNTIGTNNTLDSGSAIGNGIRLNINESANGKITVNSNQIHEVPNGRGIEAIGRLGTGGASFLITGNTLTAPTGTNQDIGCGFHVPCPLAGIYVEANTGNTVCAKITGNTVNYDPATIGMGSEQSIRVKQAGGAIFNLEGGVAGLSVNNTVVTVGSSGTINTVAANSCTPPVLFSLAPLELARSATLRDTPDEQLFSEETAYRKAATPVELSQSELNFIVQQAISRLAAMGLSDTDVSRLFEINFEVADLEEGVLAKANLKQVLIDATSDGYGWFVDQTPEADEEFPLKRFEYNRVRRSSPAFGKVDLLTVVLREMVYVLGKEKGVSSFPKSGIMSPALPPNTRRLPNIAEGAVVEATPPVVEPATGSTSQAAPSIQRVSPAPAPTRSGSGTGSPLVEPWTGREVKRTSQPDGLRPAVFVPASINGVGERPDILRVRHLIAAGLPRVSAASPMSGETVSRTIGTLPANKSVTITFRVTINDPLPQGVAQVSNQGTVSGTNFSNVLTDDPDVGGANDPTVTPVCVPATITTPLANQTVAAGTTATFTTTIQGSAPFTFVWKKNGVTLISGVSLGGRATINTTSGSGTSTSTLTISNTQSSDADTYTVDATDDCNVAVSQQSATLTVVSPPSISKSFNPTSIPAGGTSTLTFTITNPNASIALTGVGVTDTLPVGLAVADSSSTTCGGTLTTTAATRTISLSGASIAGGGSCTFAVTVTGAAAGAYTNTSGVVTSANGGNGNTASANLTVVGPPSINKSFDAATIPLNGTSVLTFTITNSSATTALTGVAFTDALPAGLKVVSATATTCGGGTLTTTAPNTITLTGGTIAAGTSCTFNVTVTGAAAGVQNNTTGNVTSTEGGQGNTASASITVVAPPSISKSFNPTNIPLNGTSTLSFTITNPNTTVGLTGVGFTDTLPAGLTVATATAATCGGGTLTTTNPGTISLTGASIAASSNCTFSVIVTGTTQGVKNNTTNAVTSTNGGTGNTASASISVASPPTISKSFGAATIPIGATATLSFTITNPNSSLGLTGVAFTDTLPAGLVVATPNGLSGGCGGGTITAVAGSNSISLSGATLAASGSCTFSVNVTGTSQGVKNNTTGAISSTETGAGTSSNTATITVLAPPTISKGFGAASLPLNGTTTLSFTITNPNSTVALTGVAFTDNLPAGLQVANPPNVSGGCGGTFTANAGGTTVSLSGGTVPAGGSCMITVNVTGTSAGIKNNTTGNVTSANGGTGGTSNTATITVVAPPTISKAFGVSTIKTNTPTTLTFTITNPNPTVALTGVAFTDNFPAGLQVANPPNATNNCGGTFTAAAGATSVSLSGATVPAGGSCTISVNVVATTPGVKNNTTGNITSANGGTGGTSNTATLSTFDMCLQDDLTRSILLFSSTTGAWQFSICSKGLTFTGQGGVTIYFCKVQLTDPAPGSTNKSPSVSVMATLNTCTNAGNATLVINGVTYNITDSNTLDNRCACQ